MANGWGDGEWHDMLWGGGAYSYDPDVVLEATGILSVTAAFGVVSPTRQAIGRTSAYVARGTLRSYTATGVLK